MINVTAPELNRIVVEIRKRLEDLIPSSYHTDYRYKCEMERSLRKAVKALQDFSDHFAQGTYSEAREKPEEKNG